ncbi:MAG: AmmeMemoRadiSam system protein B [Marinilabiliales bacterium]
MKLKIELIKLNIFIFIFLTSGCNAQETENKVITTKNQILMNRKPAVAGQFYPGEKEKLINDLKNYFAQAKSNVSKNVIALIVPHAGYVFSGSVAASGYNQLDTSKKYDRVFIIASSHHKLFKGASIYYLGNYETPLGEAKVDMDIAEKIKNENEIFTFDPDAHYYEHSVEVQVPFLQYLFGDKLKIVPIVIGTQSVEDCKKIADALKPYFTENNLFVISSDFSHYPDYENAIKIDSLTANAILSSNPDKLINTINSNKKLKINNLATSLCGWSSVLTLMYMTNNNEDYKYKLIEYKNSGDSKYGDHNRVVGYNAIVVEKQNHNSTKTSDFELNNEDKKILLTIARKTIEKYVKDGKIFDFDGITLTDNIKKPAGAFVTLHKNGQLRGCIGRFEPGDPLYIVVRDMAISSAVKDYRFNPVSEEELKDIDIEISVLTPLRKIDSIDEFELGKHGIYIKKGWASGTFLPQVAQSTGWTKEEFLGHCARDKAGIGWDGWKDADLYVYEAIIFDETEY